VIEKRQRAAVLKLLKSAARCAFGFKNTVNTTHSTCLFKRVEDIWKSNQKQQKETHSMKTIALAVAGFFMIAAVGLFAGLLVLTSPERPAPTADPAPYKTQKDIAAEAAAATLAAKKEKERERERNGFAALRHSERAVRNRLKCPSTAKFLEGWSAEYGWNQWRTFGKVDAMNPFGAVLREEWTACVTLSSNSYSIEWVKIGKNEYGKLPARAISPEQKEAEKKKRLDSERAAADKAAAKLAEAEARTLEWTHSKAKSGDAGAQYRLGLRYLSGDGVALDPQAAREWLAKAAAQGHTSASNLLAGIKK